MRPVPAAPPDAEPDTAVPPDADPPEAFDVLPEPLPDPPGDRELSSERPNMSTSPLGRRAASAPRDEPEFADPAPLSGRSEPVPVPPRSAGPSDRPAAGFADAVGTGLVTSVPEGSSAGFPGLAAAGDRRNTWVRAEGEASGSVGALGPGARAMRWVCAVSAASPEPDVGVPEGRCSAPEPGRGFWSSFRSDTRYPSLGIGGQSFYRDVPSVSLTSNSGAGAQ
ncbi:hypothetical protein NRB56_66220 [Nocardia sp. RB56]|uniref:Uncharacterized protein n=1 Tax=Nocardia aurantia TaxID=2585199 RepID=A0A7K0DYX5_9NOCA|nr:hypothetical protein [Nocardia aurantia]